MQQAGFDDIVVLRDRIYETVYDDALWVTLLDDVKRLLNAAHGAFGYFDTGTGAQHSLAAECAPEFADGVFAPELLNPLAPRLISAPAGDVFTDQSVLPRAEFERGTFFNEWFLPQGQRSSLAAIVFRQGNIAAHLTLLRGGAQALFDTDAVAQLQQLMPALQQASRLRTRVGALRLVDRFEASEAMQVGLLVVDPQGQLLALNAAAERQLEHPHCGLDARNRRLQSRLKPENDQLRGLIAAACRGVDGAMSAAGHMLVSDPETGLPAAALSVVPMRDASTFGLPVVRAAAIFIQDFGARLAPDFEAQMRALFGLTAKEAALAAALASGRTLSEAAEQRFISMPTARTHLAQIFRKTHTSQQSQLVALLLGIRPVPR
jgi:DNA-binding CsgD family transcriptional regulator/PAS domain-containing protein